MPIPSFPSHLFHAAPRGEQARGGLLEPFLHGEITEAQSDLLFEDPSQVVGRYSKLTADLGEAQHRSAEGGSDFAFQLADAPIVQLRRRSAEALERTEEKQSGSLIGHRGISCILLRPLLHRDKRTGPR